MVLTKAGEWSILRFELLGCTVRPFPPLMVSRRTSVVFVLGHSGSTLAGHVEAIELAQKLQNIRTAEVWGAGRRSTRI